MKKGLLFTFLLLVCVSTLVGCEKKEKKEKNPIVGKWAYGSGESFMYTFNSDGTCHYTANNKDCTYKVDGDKLSITYNGETASFDTTFKIEDNKLIIKDSFGSDVVYNKK